MKMRIKSTPGEGRACVKAVLGRHTALCKLKGGWWRRGHGGQWRGHRQQWRAWYELMQYRNTKVALHPLKRIGEFERDTVGSGQVRFLLSKVTLATW